MIELLSIGKVYKAGDKKIHALKNVDINFRESEFVCILGHSGCGKTTLLNIIGGLDRYTSGNLVIDGRATEKFSDSDWDAYRSSKVGFVFQSYNLIPEQSVIENVETALDINGVAKDEKRSRAIAALKKVGLVDHLRKKPRQLSGGEMQRVAIARAIVNRPSVILADEPTGALDSKNSEQIMDILKEISQNRLVVTVTHNDELAKKYATRIIKISDGKIISDSNPYFPEKKPIKKVEEKNKSVMPYSLAFKLSVKNLLSKRIRTILTAGASAIAIVGISLVIACSNGLNAFIDKVQRDTMSGTPVTVSASARNYSAAINSLFGYVGGKGGDKTITVTDGEEEKQIPLPSNSILVNHTLKSASSERITNYISEEYIDYIKKIDTSKVTYDLEYSVGKFIYKSVYTPFVENGVERKIDVFASTAQGWLQIPTDSSIVYDQYDIYGKFPTEENELALVVNKDSSISDAVLSAYFIDIFSQDKEYYTYDEILSDESFYGKFNLLSPDDYFKKEDDGEFSEKKIELVDYIMKYYKSNSESQRRFIERQVKSLLGENSVYCFDEDPYSANEGTKLKIVGIFKLKEDTQYGMFQTSPICYTYALTQKIIKDAEKSEIVKAQLASPKRMVLRQYDEEGTPYLAAIPEDKTTFSIILGEMGYSKIPNQIKFYPKTISDKDYLLSFLDEYNEGKSGEDVIEYTDNVGVAIELVRSIIAGVAAILLALTSASLVVSAIMMGIITYVSVMERTKEIGILRSVGARKKDVVNLFITESALVGVTAGVVGVLLNFIVAIPVNIAMRGLTGVAAFAFLNVWDIAIIIVGSAMLTMIAGLIPSLAAGRQDPVKALRAD